MSPTKLELLETWLPNKPWYEGRNKPDLSKAGGWRLDDPAGEVGIEFMVVNDTSGAEPVSYHIPLTYRGAPLDHFDHALIGTAEHGVLGKRWIYDGVQDPVLNAQLVAFVRGQAEAQAQNVSDTPDPTVTSFLTADANDVSRSNLHVVPVLRPGGGPLPASAVGHVTAVWILPDGETCRGRFYLVE